jgi:ribose transport system ATP-binding protein
MAESLLRATGLVKHYGGIHALTDVEFELAPAEVHGLCGENGAGKSTLVKILGGLVTPDAGEVVVGGAPLRLGHRTDPEVLSIVHQELSIVPELSVLDNVLLGSKQVGELYFRSRFRDTVRQHLDSLGLGQVDVDLPAKRLSLAERQLVEIARGVSHGARVLMLDEPTATLSDAEIQRVFSAVRWLKDRGTAVVFISHRLEEVFAITDRITVFRNGRRIFTKRVAELTSQELVHAMLGRELVVHSRSSKREAQGQSAPRLALRGLKLPEVPGPIDLEIGPGEIVGIVGQLGSGAASVVEMLAGLHKDYEGKVEIDGLPTRIHGIQQAQSLGIAYVAEDRAGKGVFLDARVQTNLTASVLKAISKAGLLTPRLESQRAESLAKLFQINARRLPDEVRQLSGGNQQKVSLGKATAIGPRLLLLNEPTRGVDIGARSEIYARLREMTSSGMSILFYSTDFEEIMELADRVITVFRGRIVRVADIDHISIPAIVMDIVRGGVATDEAVEVPSLVRARPSWASGQGRYDEHVTH